MEEDLCHTMLLTFFVVSIKMEREWYMVMMLLGPMINSLMEFRDQEVSSEPQSLTINLLDTISLSKNGPMTTQE